MFVALMAIAAFAATQAIRRAPSNVSYEKVTSVSDLTTGEYLIVCESKSLAFDGSLETLDAVGNTIEVTPSEGKIASSEAIDAATFTIDTSTGYIKSKSGFFIGSSTQGATSTSNGLKQAAEAKEFWSHSISFDEDGNAVLILNTEMALRYNAGSTQSRFRYFKSYGGNMEKIQLYKKVTTTAGPKDITIAPESGADISAALTAACEGKVVKNITINLTAGAAYTVSAPIEAAANVAINGNGATIDASALDAPFIQMSKTPAVEAVESGQFVITKPMVIDGVIVKGLKKALFADGGKSYAYETFTINNSVFEYETQESVVLNMASSMAINFNITNSTFFSKVPGTANFIALSGKRPWQITGYEEETGKLTVANCTFYNVAKKKQFLNTNTLKGQKYLYEVNSNIFVDVSNKKIYGNMTNNKKQLTTDGKNTYMFEGAFFAETNYNGDEGLPTDPEFADAANGDFTVGAGTAQAKEQTGATRWLVAYDPSKRPFKDMEITPDENDDLADVVYYAGFEDGDNYFRTGKITLNLESGKTYGLTWGMYAKNGLVINGNGATIDASNCNDYPIIAYTPDDNTLYGNYYRVGEIKLSNLNVINLAYPLFYNFDKTCIENVTVDNCQVQFNIEGAMYYAAFYFKKGLAKNFTIKNSTMYQVNDDTDNNNVAYFVYYSDNNATVGNAGYDASEKQTINYVNNTFHSLAPYGWNWYYGLYYQPSAFQFNIDSNLWVNCGGGNIPMYILMNYGDEYIQYLGGVKFNNNSYCTMNADGTSSNEVEGTTYTVDGNVAHYDLSGTAIYAAPFFRKDITKGDFTLGVCQHIGKKCGDPRWFNIPMITNLEHALATAAELLDGAQEDWASAPAINEAVENLAAAYNDNKPYIYSNSQEEIDEATARVEAAIAEFNKSMGDVTAIESVNSKTIDNGAWYTINGQRVDRPTQKGLYIHNGRKVVIK